MNWGRMSLNREVQLLAVLLENIQRKCKQPAETALKTLAE